MERKGERNGIVDEWEEDTSDQPTEIMPIRQWKKDLVKEDLDDLEWWDW